MQMRCIISNVSVSVTSHVAKVLVADALLVSALQNTRIVANDGETETLSTTAKSAIGAHLVYRWKKNNRSISRMSAVAQVRARRRVYTVIASAIAQGARRTSVAVEVTLGEDRPPSPSLYLSWHRTLGESVAVSFGVYDPDGNFAYALLRINTPNRGWLVERSDGAVVEGGKISPEISVATTPQSGVKDCSLTTVNRPGAYSFTLTAVDSVGARFETLPVEIMVVEPMTPHEVWRSKYFNDADLLNPLISSLNADPDSDGITNLMEYALGLEPTVADAVGLPEISTSARHWVYSYTRPANRSDLTYAVEVSTGLKSWSTNGVEHVHTATEGGHETWRGSYPLKNAANLFMRLRVNN
jgi:hypothetical protein